MASRALTLVAYACVVAATAPWLLDRIPAVEAVLVAVVGVVVSLAAVAVTPRGARTGPALALLVNVAVVAAFAFYLWYAAKHYLV